MTDKNLTEIVCVLDRSGSMTSMQKDAIGGFNTFLKEQKEAKIGECKLTMNLFDHEQLIVHDCELLDAVEPLTGRTYSPRGATALLDALGMTINLVGDRLSKTPEEKRPGAVIFVVLTDGAENASVEFHYDAVQELIKRQTEKYKWQFIFLAQGLDANKMGRSIGMNPDSGGQYVASAPRGAGGQAVSYKVASAATLGTRSRAMRGQEVNCDKGHKAIYSCAMDLAADGDMAASEQVLDEYMEDQKKKAHDSKAKQDEDSGGK